MKVTLRKKTSVLILVPLVLFSGGYSHASSRRAQEADINEAFFRYWFKGMESSSAKVYFLRFGKNQKDPDANFMKRFAKYRLPVKPASQAMFTDKGVRDKKSKAEGIIFYAYEIKWLSKNKVSLEGGDLHSLLAAANCNHILIRKNGKWVVVKQSECLVA